MLKRSSRQPERRRPLQKQPERPPVVQYYRGPVPEGAGRQNRQPEQRKQGTVVNHLKRLPVYLSIFAIIASLVYCSILGNKVTVIVSDAPLFEKSYYETQVGDALNSSLFNHSKLTINIRGFKEKIKSKIPEVSDVTVSIPLVGRKPVVGLTLIPAAFLLTVPGGDAYILGTNGVVLADAHKLDVQKRQGLRLLQENVPLDIKVGQTVLTSSDIAFIETVSSELSTSRLEIAQLELPVGAGELYVHLKDVPYIVKFAFNGDPRQQVGAYLAVKNQVGAAQPENYIDVRIGERVFIK